jgi:hypothetical protein
MDAAKVWKGARLIEYLTMLLSVADNATGPEPRVGERDGMRAGTLEDAARVCGGAGGGVAVLVMWHI